MPQAQPKSWWGRNWKWFVPVLGLSLVLLFAGCGAALVAIVFGAMKSCDAYSGALARAQAAPAVRAALGEPVEAGYWVMGNVNVSGPSGHADIAIPVSGPRGAGTVYAVASKSAGRWTYSTLVVVVEATGERIDLLGGNPAGGGDP